MNAQDKEDLVRILNNFETRANKDIEFLMRVSFEAARAKSPHGIAAIKPKYPDFESFQFELKRMLDL
jgi:hypothetical protein